MPQNSILDNWILCLFRRWRRILTLISEILQNNTHLQESEIFKCSSLDLKPSYLETASICHKNNGLCHNHLPIMCQWLITHRCEPINATAALNRGGKKRAIHYAPLCLIFLHKREWASVELWRSNKLFLFLKNSKTLRKFNYTDNITGS